MRRLSIHFLKINKISRQLYLIYFTAVFLPITIIGTFLLINTGRLLTNYYRDLLESDNLRVKTILFEITTQIYNMSEELAFDEDIRTVLGDSYYTRANVVNSLSGITIVDNYENNYAEVEKIEIYTDNPGFMDYKQFYKAGEEVRSLDWFQRASEQSSVFWEPLMSSDKYGNEYWNLSLIRKIPLIDSKYNAVLVIRISDNYLKTRINSQEYAAMVSVDEGPVFFSSEREMYGRPQQIAIEYGENYYRYVGNARINDVTNFVDLSTLHLYQSDSKIYISTLNDQAYSNIRSIIIVCLAIIGVAILLPGLLIYVFTHYFTSRILTLREAMHQVSNENYEIVNFVQGQDEISEAFSDLEVMVQKIKQKDADMYEAVINEQKLEREQQAMEFKMLASQINPHFLYNTLESIRMKAFTAGDREVANAIKLLGKSMRYVLENTGTAFTTLSRELEHIRTYLSIQELRFGDKFESCFEIEETINTDTVYILPLLLQPVVENALLHGLEETEAGGLVRISVYSQREEGEELLCIAVIDNGCGMEEEELTQLRRDIETRDSSRSRSIGLYNINQRIRLNYGSSYGMKIESVKEQGTTVQLVIPMKKTRLVKTAELK